MGAPARPPVRPPARPPALCRSDPASVPCLGPAWIADAAKPTSHRRHLSPRFISRWEEGKSKHLLESGPECREQDASWECVHSWLLLLGSPEPVQAGLQNSMTARRALSDTIGWSAQITVAHHPHRLALGDLRLVYFVQVSRPRALQSPPLSTRLVSLSVSLLLGRGQRPLVAGQARARSLRSAQGRAYDDRA